jgi:hypothetical protein
MTMRSIRIALLLAGALALSGCAYKPLKAPCSPDEGGVPLSYADQAPSAPAPFAELDHCGPMKPL